MSVGKDHKEIYEKMPDHLREAVDDAFRMAYDMLASVGLNTANDDRAENLVGAIARYVRECGN